MAEGKGLSDHGGMQSPVVEVSITLWAPRIAFAYLRRS